MLRVYYSPSTRRLRQEVLSTIRSFEAAWPRERLIILVPNRLNLSYEEAYLRALGRTGFRSALLLAEVMNFARIAQRILDDTGTRRPMMSTLSQTLLISRILFDLRGQLDYFGRLSGKPGFIRELLNLLQQCRRYGVTASSLRQAAEILGGDLGPRHAMVLRLHDLSAVLERYHGHLRDVRTDDTSSVLESATEALLHMAPGSAGAARLARTKIIVSGFGEMRDFTPQEYRFLRTLARRIPELRVTVAADRCDAAGDPADTGHDTATFERGRRTLRSMARHFADIPGGITYTRLDPVIDPSLRPLVEAYAPAVADTAAWATEREGDGESKGFELVYAPNQAVEAELAAARILDWVGRGMCRFRDISVLVLDGEETLPVLKGVFAAHGIPIYLDSPYRLAGSALRLWVLSLINLARFGWDARVWKILLDTGLTPLTDEEAAIFENACLARGIDRRSFWFDDRYIKDRADADRRMLVEGEGARAARLTLSGRDTPDDGEDPPAPPEPEEMTDDEDASVTPDEDTAARPPGMETEAWERYLLTLRDRAFGPLRDIVAALRQTRDLGERAAILADATALAGLPEAVERQAKALTEAGASEAADHLVAGLSLLDELLQTYAEEGRGIACGLADCYSYFDAALQASFRQSIPTRVDQVRLARRETAAHFPDQYLLILGATRDLLPRFREDTGLFTEGELRRLAELLPEGFGGKEAPAHGDAYQQLWQYLMNPTRLVLFHAGGEDDASRLYRDLRRYVPTLTTIHTEAPGEPEADSLRRLLDAPEPAGPSETSAPSGRDAALSATPQVPSLPRELVADLLPQPLTMSISRLERYISCPYRYLQHDMIKLTERLLHRPEFHHVGSYLHKVMEIFYREQGRKMDGMTPEQVLRHLTELQAELQTPKLDGLITRLMGEAIREDERLGLFGDAVHRGGMGRKVRQALFDKLPLSVAELRAAAYFPDVQEWRFGMGEHPGPTLLLPDGEQLHFRGIIDRIDRSLTGARSYRIVDYKSGSRSVAYDRLWHGLDLQLPVYLDAVRTGYGDDRMEAATAMYFSLKLDTEHAPAQTAEDATVIPDGKEAVASGAVLEAGEGLPALLRHSRDRATEQVEALRHGELSAKPRAIRERNPKLPCRYCLYRSHCRMEHPAFHYDALPGMTELKAAYRAQGKKAPGKNAEMFKKLLEDEATEKGDR